MLTKLKTKTSLFSFAQLSYGGYYIRMRQLIKALVILNDVVNIVEFGYRIPRAHKKSKKYISSPHYFLIKSISQAPSKNPPYYPLRQITFQLESLKVLVHSKMIRSSQVAFFTSEV